MSQLRWKTGGIMVAFLMAAAPVIAQEPLSFSEPPQNTAYQPLSQADLDELVAPIALYPDPLIGIVLPASTFPLQIVQASRYLNANKGAVDPPQGTSWDSSVIALLRYPDVLLMMDERIDWTGRLGDAMYYQEDEVMAAVQRVRAKAENKGILESNEKQQIVQDNGVIRIEPAQPEVIYVPVYDPQVIFVETAPVYPVITYSVGFGYGPWLPYTCDWYGGGFFFTNFYFGGHWHTHHSGHHDYWRPYHRPRGHHGDGDWDDDSHHGEGGGGGHNGGGDGHDGNGGGHNGDNRDIVDRKIPRNGEGNFNEKVPGDVISSKVPKTDPSGYPIENFQGGSNSGKVPRFEGGSNISREKVPSGITYGQKPSRTMMKIPNQSTFNGGQNTRSFENRGFSTRSYSPKTPSNNRVQNISPSPQTYKVPSQNFSYSPQTYKVPSQNYGARSYNYSAPSAPSMKVPSSHGYSGGGGGGKGFGGGGGGFGGGGGGGKVPKGGK